MANHLTPEELSKEVGMERDEVIRICVEEAVPIYQGKIDKYLFQAQVQALGAPPKHWGGGLSRRVAAARLRDAAFFFAAGFFPAAATEARSASIRSTTGASAAAGSGAFSSWPSSLAWSSSRSDVR